MELIDDTALVLELPEFAGIELVDERVTVVLVVPADIKDVELLPAIEEPDGEVLALPLEEVEKDTELLIEDPDRDRLELLLEEPERDRLELPLKEPDRDTLEVPAEADRDALELLLIDPDGNKLELLLIDPNGDTLELPLADTLELPKPLELIVFAPVEVAEELLAPGDDVDVGIDTALLVAVDVIVAALVLVVEAELAVSVIGDEEAPV